MTKISNEKQIGSYMHCSMCLQDKPDGVSPQQYQSLEIGWTKQGLQVWCKRHDCNVIHMDFEGTKHPANTTARSEPKKAAAN